MSTAEAMNLRDSSLDEAAGKAEGETAYRKDLAMKAQKWTQVSSAAMREEADSLGSLTLSGPVPQCGKGSQGPAPPQTTTDQPFTLFPSKRLELAAGDQLPLTPSQASGSWRLR